MKEVQLTKKSDLTEGGCNACGIIDSTIYQLDLGGKKAMIAELSVGSLVDSLALLEGFEGGDIYEMLGEIRQLRHAEKCVEVRQEDGLIHFQKDHEVLTVKNVVETPELYQQVNQILKQFFDLGPYKFTEKKQESCVNTEWQKTIEEQTNNTYLFQ
ncbi:hypothetical protein IGI47_000693 [Enterococcus sp. AZ191]|uniref:DUF4809 family protein n=1 Tax=Enterococcus sp. AZ191 TaxID=2774639 RepID=UPI003F209CF8